MFCFYPSKAEPKNPEFHSTYGSTQQDISINFTTLEVIAHAEAILNLTEFADNMVAAISGKQPEIADDEGFEDEGYLSEDDKKPVSKCYIQHWAILFEIHTPPLEDFENGSYRGRVIYIVANQTADDKEFEDEGYLSGDDKKPVSKCWAVLFEILTPSV